MAQISIRVSTHHGSEITVSPMVSDDCLGFDTTVYLKVENSDIEPFVYSKDTVTIHGDLAAIHLLLEKCLNAVNERLRTQVTA